MKTMAKKRLADVLVDTLAAAGVKNIYGLAGDSLNGITDSIRARDNIKQAGVKTTDRGYVKVNERLETMAPDVWAVGECAGSPHFTQLRDAIFAHPTMLEGLIPLFTNVPPATAAIVNAQALPT
jgi:hypothetical protein